MVSKKYLLILIIFVGCGYYSFKGSLPSSIKNVAIPLFDDRTAYPGVREDLTNKVIDEFIADNTLRITDESDADIIISGIINSITQKAAVLSKDETVQKFQIFVNVKAKCEDIKNKKVLWETTFNEFGDMPGTGSQEERDIAIKDAIDKITENIINNTLAYW